MAISMEKYEEIRKAGKVLCDFCEAEECDYCMVSRLIDDAEIESGMYDDEEDDETADDE